MGLSGKQLDKFFRSDKTMIASYVLIIIGTIYQFIRVFCVMHYAYPLSLTLYVTVLLYSTVVVFTYKSHDKNIMKPAIGMLIGAITVYSMNVFFENIMDPEALADYFNKGATGYISLTLDFLQFALFFVFGIMHLAVNKSHDSSKKLLTANKITVISLYIVYILQVIFSVPLFTTEKIIYLAVFYITLAGVTTLLVNIESKIDFFRDLRAKNKQKTD